MYCIILFFDNIKKKKKRDINLRFYSNNHNCIMYHMFSACQSRSNIHVGLYLKSAAYKKTGNELNHNILNNSNDNDSHQ